jgi:hypothetical protein
MWFLEINNISGNASLKLNKEIPEASGGEGYINHQWFFKEKQERRKCQNWPDIRMQDK